MNLYQELLMDHYKQPRNYGQLAQYDFSTGDYIPSCGDAISMQGRFANGVLQEIAFMGKGCVISQATASLLTQYAKGKTIEQLQAMNADDVQTLIGVTLGPLRIKCALLPLFVLQQGIQQFQNTHKDNHA